VVHPEDGYSNRSSLSPPTPDEVTRLAQLSRQILPEAIAIRKPTDQPRNIRRRLSQRAIDELIARYTAGEVTPTLSREYGISPSGLRDLLRAEGVSLRGRAITPEDVKKAVQLYEHGLTITEVVRHIGYSRDTIRTALRKHGVALRSGSHKKKDGVE
jgi:AraC-like DNA-binding protein